MSHIALIADIGGTNCRLSLVDLADNTTLAESRLSTPALPCLANAAAEFCLANHQAPSIAVMAIAGPTDTANQQGCITNVGLTVKASDLAAAMPSLRAIRIVNDFEAVGYSLPQISSDSLISIRQGQSVADSHAVLIGPGTGLGSVVVRTAPHTSQGYFVQPCEAGHTPALLTAKHAKTMKYFRFHMWYTYEQLVSGRGLPTLYSLFKPVTVAAAEIVSRAHAAEPEAQKTLKMFSELLGQFAACHAINNVTRKGVYLVGDMLPKLAEFFDHQAFNQGFSSIAGQASWLNDVPVYLVAQRDLGLAGTLVLANSLKETLC